VAGAKDGAATVVEGDAARYGEGERGDNAPLICSARPRETADSAR
jgi:hypothetical protein